MIIMKIPKAMIFHLKRSIGGAVVSVTPTMIFALFATAGLARAAAAPRIELENVRVGFGGRFEVGRWTPVWLQLRAGSERFTGIVELGVPDDDDTPTFVRRAIDVPAGGSAVVSMYVRCGSTILDNWKARAIDENMRSYRLNFNEESMNSVSPLEPFEVLVLTFGDPQGVERIAELPGFRVDAAIANGSPSTQGRSLLPIKLNPIDPLPNRWYGYESAQAIVIDTGDKDVIAALGSGREKPLIDWVKNGGHLVVAVGSNWRAVKDGPFASILPAVPEGSIQLNDLDALETYAASKKPIQPPGGPRVTVTKLALVPGRGGKTLDADPTTPLVVRGPCGFGRVTVVAVDVNLKPFSAWEDRNLFWLKTIDLKGSPGQTSNYAYTAAMGGPARRISYSNVSDLSTSLRGGLESFPAVKLVPFAWVAFFIFLYILLIGPGDYLFLRKVVKRMEFTWITFPIIVLSVSAIAYIAAYSIKGTDLRVNKIDAVDIDQTSGLMRGTSWFTVFSPRNDDYSIGIEPLSFHRDPKADVPASNSDPAPNPAGVETIVTWFGVPESGYGGMNNPNRLGLSSTGYSYEPVGEAERIVGARVPIWSTRSFQASWRGRGETIIESSIESASGERVLGTIKNLLPVPLKDVHLAYGKQVFELGTIAPGKTAVVETAKNRSLAGYVQDALANRNINNGNGVEKSAHPAADSARLVRAMMFYSTAGSEAAVLENHLFRELDLSSRLALDGAILFAEIERPASVLYLGKGKPIPKIDQATVLRVVLPMNPPANDSN